jgi:ubiquitin C-terminal hydrolase
MRSSPPIGLPGLKNAGNTCFANVVVRLFLSSPDFELAAATTPHFPNCARRTRDGKAAPECLMCQLELLRAEMARAEAPVVPRGVLDQRLAIGPGFPVGEEADAVAFFQALVEKLHASDPRSSPICQGSGESVVTCLDCGTTSTTWQPCVNIELNVRGVYVPAVSYRSSFYNAAFEVAGSAATTTVEEALKASAEDQEIKCVRHGLFNAESRCLRRRRTNAPVPGFLTRAPHCRYKCAVCKKPVLATKRNTMLGVPALLVMSVEVRPSGWF